jgi:lysozyme family protein
MMATEIYSEWFNEAFDELIGIEGGYVNHSNDPGGATNWGITQRVCDEHFPDQDVKDLTLSQAKSIYWDDYWTKMNLDQLESKVLALELFEMGVNIGTARAIIFAQKACNFLAGSKGRNTIAVDGVLGPRTKAELCFWTKNNLKAIYRAINGLQFMHYYKLVTETEWAYPFGAGWMLRVWGKDV